MATKDPVLVKAEKSFTEYAEAVTTKLTAKDTKISELESQLAALKTEKEKAEKALATAEANTAKEINAAKEALDAAEKKQQKKSMTQKKH